MDSEVTFMLKSPAKWRVDRKSTLVRNSEQFNRKSCTLVESEIDLVWKNRLKENPKLYNGTKFRLDSVEFKDEMVIFNIGISCYRDFIGTNWSPNAKNLSEKGKQQYNNCQAFMSDALGVGAMVLSNDKYVTFQMRSLDCGEAAGLWDIPGGHAEPKELVGKKLMEEIQIENLNPDEIKEEIYNSILKEVVDEVNVPTETLSDPILMGICRNTTSSGRPSAEFLICCSLSGNEITELYQKGSQAEADESTCIRLLSLEDVLKMTVDHEMWKSMAPSCKGCISLAKEFNFDNL